MPTTDREYRPRLSIEISQEQADKLYKHIAWGEKRRIFAIIVEDLITAFDKFGADKIMGAIKAREVSVMDFVKLNLEDPDEHS